VRIAILALCASARRDSLNQKLLDVAVSGACDAGAQISKIRLIDFHQTSSRLTTGPL
jgi:chromate reductase, NAD(P)H dehydrogenase (quinone)